MKTHELKCWPPYFDDARRGDKTFEYRKDDRHFAVGDTLLLREWVPECHASPLRNFYSGREVTVDVLYKVDGDQFGIPEGYCILGIRLRAIDGVEPNAPQRSKKRHTSIMSEYGP